MQFGRLRRFCGMSRRNFAVFRSVNVCEVNSVSDIGKCVQRFQSSENYSAFAFGDDEFDKGTEKNKLAMNLASLIEESLDVDLRKPRTRMELKRSLEVQIKKRVKAQYVNGKFMDLMGKVIACPTTLQNAYDCVRINSNVDIATNNHLISFESMAEELRNGNFDFNANIFSISSSRKEALVLPKLKLKVLQEAIRLVLECVFRPHFSKISHGCRNGRGHSSSFKYIRKEINNPDWWFTLDLSKKMDQLMMSKLITVMEDKIEDPNLFAVIRSIFDAGALNLEFGGFPKNHGLPQEGVLSPILMNIYLNLFDQEFFRLSMKYEAINEYSNAGRDGSQSKLRSWFRRQLKGNDSEYPGEEKDKTRVYCCRYMDEIFLVVSGSKEVALSFRSEIQDFVQNSLHLDVSHQGEIASCTNAHGIRFLGCLVRRREKESPAVKAVHKLKKKVELFALQKEEAWNAWTVWLGKKWLAHGLKKVKESEIKHLAKSSHLNQISSFRKVGMETDHWYKALLKTWMQDINARAADSEETFLTKHVVEPSLPLDLRDSYYEFQRCVKEYVSSETASTVALLPNYDPSVKSTFITEIIAPVDSMKKRLLRYRLITNKGYPCPSPFLILQDNTEIVEWFLGVSRRWYSWYSNCSNFNELILLCEQVRKSCIRTLAAKHRLHESEIEKKFDSELSRIYSSPEIEQEEEKKTSNGHVLDHDEALMYGISHSGLCLLSLARMVSQSRPCNCFVMGCLAPAPSVYTLHVMERQKFPGWNTGFSSCIHPSLNRQRLGLCKQHLKDLYLGHISLQSIDFGAWKRTHSKLNMFNCEVLAIEPPKRKVDEGSNNENLGLQNIQARIRMVLAFMLASRLPWVHSKPGFYLVLGSSNVDEGLCGYLTKYLIYGISTLYDCSSADINPIGSISKQDLPAFLSLAASHLGYSSMADIKVAPPTAELEPIRSDCDYCQLDEVDMGMTYEELSVYGELQKIFRCGPVSMFKNLCYRWGSKLTPSEVAEKVKYFFNPNVRL